MARSNRKPRWRAPGKGQPASPRDPGTVPESRPVLDLTLPLGPLGPLEPLGELRGEVTPYLVLADEDPDLTAQYLITDERCCREEIAKESNCCACGGVYSQRLDGSSFCKSCS